MEQLKFNINPGSSATPYVSEVLSGGKTFVIAFPEGVTSSIFVKTSLDGVNWQSKQSVSPTNKASFNVRISDNTFVRLLVSSKPSSAEYKDYNTGGGGSGTVKSVNGVAPDANGNVEITVGGGTYATNTDIDNLWKP